MDWKKKLRQASDALTRLQSVGIPVHAAHASFFLVLSVFPMVILLLGLLRYTNLEVSDLMDLAEAVIPAGLLSLLERLLTVAYSQSTHVVVSVSALAALWSAGKGIYALKTGLDAVYGVRDPRPWLATRLLSAFYMVLFLLVLLLTLVLHVFSGTLLRWLRLEEGLLPRIVDLLNMRLFLLEAVQTMVFCAMFMFLPGRRNGFRESLPGALLSCLGWLAVSHLFSLYMEYFPRYFSVFGSLYTVAVAMLWLYVCVSVVFYGGLLNRILTVSRDNRSKS